MDSSFDSMNTTENVQPASSKVDLYTLSKLMNVVSLSELAKRNICKENKFGAAFHARSELKSKLYGQLTALDEMYGFHITGGLDYVNFTTVGRNPNGQHNLNAEFNIFPQTTKYNEKAKGSGLNQINLPMNKAAIIETYGTATLSSKQCAIFVMPLKSVAWDKEFFAHVEIDPKDGKTKKYSLEKIITNKMILWTQKPESIRKAATNFINEYMQGAKSGYLAIHWRFNEEEMRQKCQMNGKAANCKTILATPEGTGQLAEKVGENLAMYLVTMAQLLPQNGKLPIYIAGPKTAIPFIEGIKSYFTKNKMGNMILSQTNLQKFVDFKFGSSCPRHKFLKQQYDFISQIEQELCMRSKIFYESDGSSWSVEVKYGRLVRGPTKDDMKTRLLIDPQ